MGPHAGDYPENDLLLGIPGAGVVHPGSHVCALFSGPVERDRLLISFMQEGLRHGDHCVCLIDELEQASVRQSVYGPTGWGDTRWPVDVYSAPDAYLRPGDFSSTELISILAQPGASDGVFPLLRAAGQMAPLPHASGAAEFSVYEAAVGQILAELPTVFLCMYDVEKVGAGILADVLKVHAMVLVDGEMLYNPRISGEPPTPARPTSTLLAPPRTSLSAGHDDGCDPWPSLTGAEIRVAELVGVGLSNRATAQELIVSPHTVDAHLKHIYQKLGIHSRVELAVLTFNRDSRSA